MKSGANGVIPLLPLSASPSVSANHGAGPLSPPILVPRWRRASPERIAASSGVLCLCAFYIIFPTASTLHWYLAGIVWLGAWIISEAFVLAWAWRKRKATISHWTGRRKALAGFALIASLWLFFQGSRLPAEIPLPVVPLGSTPLLIAMTVHDNEILFPRMMEHLLRAIEHIGRRSVHLSLLESSRSSDTTHDLLTRYEMMLHDLDVHHTVARLNLSDEHGYWTDEQSRDHISRHAFARNKALEPLEAGLEGQAFRKIIFADAIYFDWTDLIRLLATSDGQFDLACGLEWGAKGLSDAWSFRDRCGVRARPAWPHLLHGEASLDAGQVFDVAACWHSMAAVDAAPFLHSSAASLREAMVRDRKQAVLAGGTHVRKPPDTSQALNISTDGRADPGMASVPLDFHTTPVEECTASEGMLLAYDLHLLHRPARPRIFVNPRVNVARCVFSDDLPDHGFICTGRSRNWYILYLRVLRRPFVRPWVHLWDRYLGPMLLSAAREMGRTTEQCQWQGFILADGCPPPPNGALGLVA